MNSSSNTPICTPVHKFRKEISTVCRTGFTTMETPFWRERRNTKGSRDIFAMVSRKKTALRRLLESSCRWVSRLSENMSSDEDEFMGYISDQRIERYLSLINTSLGMITLVARLWILAFVDHITHRLAVITSFLFCFLCIVTYATPARLFESLSATAA